MREPRRAWGLAAALLALAATAHAQAPGCSGPPPPPEEVVASLLPAGERPALLTLDWAAPDARNGAPDAYVVEAGSAPGFADLARAEVHTAARRFAVPLASGTYYVRLRARNACGAGRASDEITVPVEGSTAPGAPNPVVLLDTVNAVRERLAGTAFIRVTGRVRNGWRAGPAAFTEVTAVFDGPAGEASERTATFVNARAGRLPRSRLVTDTVLDPGADGCFELFAVFPAFQITGVRFEVAAEALAAGPPAGRLALDGPPRQEADPFGDLRVAGAVANTGDVPVDDVTAWVEVSDGAGLVHGCQAAPVTGARAPGDTGRFETGVAVVYEPGLAARAWLTWQEEAGDATPAAIGTLSDALAALMAADEQDASPDARVAARDALRRARLELERSLAR